MLCKAQTNTPAHTQTHAHTRAHTRTHARSIHQTRQHAHKRGKRNLHGKSMPHMANHMPSTQHQAARSSRLLTGAKATSNCNHHQQCYPDPRNAAQLSTTAEKGATHDNSAPTQPPVSMQHMAKRMQSHTSSTVHVHIPEGRTPLFMCSCDQNRYKPTKLTSSPSLWHWPRRSPA